MYVKIACGELVFQRVEVVPLQDDTKGRGDLLHDRVKAVHLHHVHEQGEPAKALAGNLKFTEGRHAGDSF